MMRLGLLAGLLASAQVSNAQSIERPDNLPPGFEQLIVRGASRCGSEDTAVFGPGGFTTPFDLNDDGVKDYIVNSDYFRCHPARHLIYGGTAGTHYSGATGCVSAMFWSNFENKFIGKGY